MRLAQLRAQARGRKPSPRWGEEFLRLAPMAIAETDLQHAAELFELWRLCCKSRCRRSRACRGDTRACCEMLVDWSEALLLKDKRVGFMEAIERLLHKGLAAGID
jgi:hypothetical protein